MTKKGISGMTLIIAGLVIAVVIIFAYSVFFVEQITKTKGFISKIGRAVDSQACKQQGESLKLRLGMSALPENRDADRDGYPDSCDFCQGENDAVDDDNDGLPNDCDDNSNVPVKPDASFAKICRDNSGTWREEPPQCMLQNNG